MGDVAVCHIHVNNRYSYVATPVSMIVPLMFCHDQNSNQPRGQYVECPTGEAALGAGMSVGVYAPTPPVTHIIVALFSTLLSFRLGAELISDLLKAQVISYGN